MTESRPLAGTELGREPDASGLYFMRAILQSAAGVLRLAAQDGCSVTPRSRFISADPIGLGGRQVNFLAYVGNSPMNFIDPLGLLWGGSINVGPLHINWGACAQNECNQPAPGPGGGPGPGHGPQIGVLNGNIQGSPNPKLMAQLDEGRMETLMKDYLAPGIMNGEKALGMKVPPFEGEALPTPIPTPTSTPTPISPPAAPNP